ncbi:Nose resistant to fluoxetine protein 6 [Fragariocoptes setiger]|uniref:Nose resistant to fluoxetine protein 6 n=1 Tax=Fragariocoptes setiger TaxID=1670756 RepID=A0ABQ7S975_9ACAR|nr:Nose resistant to fluoxetine protein 6 [Fragariocoptes setiger]
MLFKTLFASVTVAIVVFINLSIQADNLDLDLDSDSQQQSYDNEYQRVNDDRFSLIREKMRPTAGQLRQTDNEQQRQYTQELHKSYQRIQSQPQSLKSSLVNRPNEKDNDNRYREYTTDLESSNLARTTDHRDYRAQARQVPQQRQYRQRTTNERQRLKSSDEANNRGQKLLSSQRPTSLIRGRIIKIELTERKDNERDDLDSKNLHNDDNAQETTQRHYTPSIERQQTYNKVLKAGSTRSAGQYRRERLTDRPTKPTVVEQDDYQRLLERNRLISRDRLATPSIEQQNRRDEQFDDLDSRSPRSIFSLSLDRKKRDADNETSTITNIDRLNNDNNSDDLASESTPAPSTDAMSESNSDAIEASESSDSSSTEESTSAPQSGELITDPTSMVTDEETVAPESSEPETPLLGIQPKSIYGGEPPANKLPEDLETDPPSSPSNNDESNKSESKNPEIASVGASRRKTKKTHKPVNMTEIDQLFKAFKPEAEVVEIWQTLNSKLKDGVKSLLGGIVPTALDLIHETRISTECSGAMLKWVLSMNQLKSWSLRMLDAFGKPSAGLLEGSMTLFGNYRQCLKVRAPDDDEMEEEGTGEFKELFRGKYCVAQLKPWLPEKQRFYNLNTKIKALMSYENTEPWTKSAFDELSELAINFNFVNIRMDLCVPSLCQVEDMQRILNYLSQKLNVRSRILRCEVEGGQGNERFQEYPISKGNHTGTSREQVLPLSGADFESVDWLMVGWAVAPILLVSVTLLATIIIVSLRLTGSASSSSWSTCQKETLPSRSWIKSMSLWSSLQHQAGANLEHMADQKPLSLYGLRFFVILWFIFVESTINLKFEYLRELLMLKDLITWWPLQIIINSSLQFDTIILITAFTCSYYSIDANMRTLIKYALDKYVRLAPSIVIVAAMAVGLPHIYRGPVWNDYVAEQAQICKHNGLINALFVQNLLPYNKVCLPHSWLVCVELQLLVVMIPIMYALNREYEKNAQFRCLSLPVLLLLSSVALSWAYAFSNVYTKDLPPAWLYTMPDPDSRAVYFTEHLFKTMTHLSTFAIGILAGHICRIRARHTSMSGSTCLRTFCNILFGMAAFATMAFVIFFTHDWSLGELPKPLVAATFDATARIAWSISFTWILHHISVPNEDRQYSLISRVLSHPALVWAGRLSFLTYLVHPIVHTSFLAIQEQPVFSSWLMLFHVLSGNIILTMLISLIISVLVETPVRNLFRRWFSHGLVATQLSCDAIYDTKSQFDNKKKLTDSMNGALKFSAPKMKA